MERLECLVRHHAAMVPHRQELERALEVPQPEEVLMGSTRRPVPRRARKVSALGKMWNTRHSPNLAKSAGINRQKKAHAHVVGSIAKGL